MNIISVIPLKKTILTEPLTYFTKHHLSLGQIVHVPIRKQEVPAVVVRLHDSQDERADIKSSSYALKKISKVTHKHICTPDFVEAIYNEAIYYAFFTPRLFSLLTSSKIIDSLDTIKSQGKDFVTKPIHNKSIASEKYAVQAEEQDRYSEYKNIIRETLARKQSAIVIVPTLADLDHVSVQLKRGIEKHTRILDSRKTKTYLAKTWNEIVHNEGAQLIITTGSFMHVPKVNIGVMIVERESSAAYRTIEKPYLDIRHLAHEYCSIARIPLYVGDTLLRAETIYSIKQGNYTEKRPLMFRSLSPAVQTLVMMQEDTQPESPYLSHKAISLIQDAHEQNDQVFIFCGRKGLAPTVVCEDCGSLSTCEHCSAPMTLFGGMTDKENTLRCNHCGKREKIGMKCHHCGSWKLKMLGIGTESVAREIGRIFPQREVFIIDSMNTRTPKQVRDTIMKFYEVPDAILVGTELAITHLTKPIPYSIVSSIDALCALPDYRIRERITQTLLALRQKTHKHFMIQTRNEHETLFNHVLTGNLLLFYKEEIAMRKQFSYPPFIKLIKLTRAGDKEDVRNEMKQLIKFFEPHTLHVYPAFTEKVANAYVLNGLIRVSPEQWPDKELIEKLRMLPKTYRVEVDAQHVL